MTTQLLPMDVASYEPHPLHATERTWTETNCYVDLWIEVLHSLGLDPLAAAAFTLSTDFEGDQWTFFKFPPEDLRFMFGIEVAEMNIWRPVVDHIEEQLSLGRLLTVEADAWYLPDTYGVSYGMVRTKTTIVPRMLDRGGRRLGYFHNAGYYELSGDDFTGLFDLEGERDAAVLPPYVETVRVDRIIRGDPDLVGKAVELARIHVERRPDTNPIGRLQARIQSDLPWLARQELEVFHLYAFGTCRQCGASAELAASFVEWLASHGMGGGDAAANLRVVAERAKTLQFALARVVRGRDVDLDSVFDDMRRAWELAMIELDLHYAR